MFAFLSEGLREGLAVGVAVAASLLLNYAIYLQKKAVVELPEVKAKLSWELIKAFITNKPWLYAQTVNIAGFALYAFALSIAPVSIVEPLIASGVALLAYLAIKHLGEAPRRIDLVAIGMNVLGVILIGISMIEPLPEDNLDHELTLWILTGVIVAGAILVPLLMRKGTASKQAAGLGISVGLLFGIAAVYTRLVMLSLTDPALNHRWLLFVIFILACIAFYLPGFIILQAALQKGMAVLVAPIYNGLMEFVPIVVGLVALGESLPRNHFLAALRLTAFVLILVGTVILSQRAEGELEEPDAVETAPAGEHGGA